MKRYIWSLIFIFVLVVVSFLYNYQEIAFKRPQSVHSWRQTDCASIALNYYQGGMKFFQPETHNLTSDGGTTGKACTSEIPILYYTVAGLYKVFGYNEAIFRILNTLLFFIGLFYLFRLLNYLLKDGVWAISIALLFFTSPVLVFYGNNFLSNSSALSFSIVAWYYFLRFYSEEKNKWFYLTVLALFVAATFKVTALFSLFAIGGIYLVDVIGITNFKKNGKLFNQPLQKLMLFALVISVIAAWVFYARYYNHKHNCTYFSTTIFPIWMLDSDGIKAVVDTVRNVWLYQYFHASVLVFIGVGLVTVLLFYKRNLKLLNFALAFIFVEVIVYVLLQFWTFKDHDYYTIDIYILPVIILTSFFYILKTKFSGIFLSPFSKIIFAVFVVFNIYQTQRVTMERYEGWMNNNGNLSDAYSITNYLREIGITTNDRIISIPDGSHVSLYLMNQKGWTEYSDARLNREEPILYNRDSSGVQKSINNGAKYLVLNGIGQLYEKPYLQNFCTKLIGRYKNTLVFKLNDEESNFDLQNREVAKRYFCAAEICSPDNKTFLGTPDSAVFRNGETRSADYVFKGEFACKLNKSTPYGFTISIPELCFGESFQISVWRKESSKGTIIASAKDYYNNSFEIVESSNGWQKLTKSFFVTKELEDKELVVYLYNNEDEAVYFDNFEIIRYKSVLE